MCGMEYADSSEHVSHAMYSAGTDRCKSKGTLLPSDSIEARSGDDSSTSGTSKDKRATHNAGIL